MPIRVPPGRMDVAPSIELTYSSRAGNGPLGLGFAIGGLSNITRCRKSLAHEEAAEGIKFDTSDRFCLDGQKLESIAGAYGSNGAEYRTERFSGSQIKSLGNGLSPGEPASFEVRSSSGRILKYGGGSASTLSGLFRLTWTDANAGGTATYGWLLQSELDRFGNGIHYDYQRLGTGPDATWNSQRKLTQIRYTSNESAGLTSTRLVRFVYEARQDVVEQWIAGMKLRWDQRLARIEVLGPKVPDGQPELLWTYALEYEESPRSGLSRLKSVQWCDADGGCLPATSFAWGADGGFEEGSTEPKYREVWRAAQGVSTDREGFTQLHLVDLDGDGRDDLVYEPLHPSETSTSARVHQSNLA